MKERTVIITGANSGIGKAAALRFAMEGYTVIMACRDMERSRKAQKEMIETSNNANIHLMEVDMSSFHSIRAFYPGFIKQLKQVLGSSVYPAYADNANADIMEQLWQLCTKLTENHSTPMGAKGVLPEDFGEERGIELLDSKATDVVSSARLRKNEGM